jgi:uncharacterized phage-associated protein
MPISKNEKIINALLYAIEQYPEIGRTKLMKFVFFVDLIFYNLTQNTLLENEYKKLPYGPVPDFPFYLTECSNDIFEIKRIDLFDGRERINCYPKKKSDRQSLTQEEMEFFDLIIGVLKSYNTPQISDLTHNLSMWEKFEIGDNLPLETFKLNEYEFNNIMSFLDNEAAIRNAESCEFYYNGEYSDTVPEEIKELQILTTNLE